MDGTLFGRYRLIELLGRGGMGDVWRAYDTTAVDYAGNRYITDYGNSRVLKLPVR